MKWKGRQGSSNVEDRRGGRAQGGINIPMGGKGLGCGGLIVILILIFLGADPLSLLQQTGGTIEPTEQARTTRSDDDDELAKFVSVVLKDTEDVWQQLFKEQLG